MREGVMTIELFSVELIKQEVLATPTDTVTVLDLCRMPELYTSHHKQIDQCFTIDEINVNDANEGVSE